jgi:putative ABC transport system permease protein
MAYSVKLAVRSLFRSPGFSLLAVAIIALGIGATTAMFSITHTVLLKPLAYRDPDSLATLLFRVPQFSKELSTVPVNAQHYLLWRDHSRTKPRTAKQGARHSGNPLLGCSKLPARLYPY